MYSENWRVDAHAIDGTTGAHYDLAPWVELKGFEVRPDPDDTERSIILRPGSEDSGDREIGVIVGDDEAVVRMDPPEPMTCRHCGAAMPPGDEHLYCVFPLMTARTANLDEPFLGPLSLCCSAKIDEHGGCNQCGEPATAAAIEQAEG